MKDLLIECRTALGLAKSMAKREKYDTDVYTKRIEMIDKALSQHDVIKNEVAVCPECGCNKVQKLAGDNYSCMNAYCEWQTVL